MSSSPAIQKTRILQRALPGLAGICLLTIMSCGQKVTSSTTKRSLVQVSTEAGPLPAAGSANRLLNEQSAFLRNHAQDAVDWYPWGDEAFAKARAENKILLVSIGYASCPWSQKMQQESFTDPETARFMNRHYVNILVDREERPDVNNSYLHFLFYKYNQSGWPLHMWLTPEGLPVFGGVYFPKYSETDVPSWGLTIEHVANTFRDDPAYIKRQADTVVKEYLTGYRKYWKGTDKKLTPEALAGAFNMQRSMYDPVNGGFSAAPKFPQPHLLNYLMFYATRLGNDQMGHADKAREMLKTTLDAIMKGGITDHLGGGLHRYSTDIYWAIPQFEKMLYDQGLIGESLVNASVLLDRPDYADSARAVLRYADTELGHPEGGFYCAEGSSSPTQKGAAELTDGAYYAWKLDEIKAAAGPAAMPLLTLAWGLDERGNVPIDSPVRNRFPNVNVIRMDKSLAEIARISRKTEEEVSVILNQAREKLLETRKKRPRPILDDKVVVSWNGTMISALARASMVLDEVPLRDRAIRAADFILQRLRRPDGTLIHAFLDGPSAASGYSEDYAMVVRAMIELYQATGEIRWLRSAVELQDKQISLLWDPVDGGFFDGPPQPLLFNRIKSVDESSEFAPNATSTLNLALLGNLLARKDYLEKANKVVGNFGSLMMQTPHGFVRLLQAYDALNTPPVQILVAGSAKAPDRPGLLKALRRCLPYGTVILYLDGGGSQTWLSKGNNALANFQISDSSTTLHLCRNFKEFQTITKAEDVAPALRKAVSMSSP